MSSAEYIKMYKNTVIDSVTGTPLFPSVLMAQGLLESGYGESSLASLYNNHFGMKAGKSWLGMKVNMNTREVVAGQDETVGAYFRVYKNPADSFLDRNLNLMSGSVYWQSGVFSAPTPELQAYAIQKAGYASDPNYAQTLITLIDRYNLKSLDAEIKKKGCATSVWLPFLWGCPPPHGFYSTTHRCISTCLRREKQKERKIRKTG